jgi:siderophore synthetase component
MSWMEKAATRLTSRQADFDQDADYICTRVIDALLRENVRDCVTSAKLVDSLALPTELASSIDKAQQWLEISHFGESRLWIPVTPHDFMQSWRWAKMPLLRHSPIGWKALYTVADILESFRHGLNEEEARGFVEFEKECQAAYEQRRACEVERQRWFGAYPLVTRIGESALPEWAKQLLHYDRLASFQDHPFYPTARAKLGFNADDLRVYSPEFHPLFSLNWLAVPRSMYFQSGENLPPNWPTFSQLGLPEHLSATHGLIPVHPFVWKNQLDQFLQESGLIDDVVKSPCQAISVTPTLSVRALALVDTPAWHVKVPLTIRTLGGRNIRTIKPSTVTDGHRVQTLLGKIIESEASLRGRIILTDEGTGAHVANQSFLGFIVRRYPEAELGNTTLAPIAALAASSASGGKVVDDLVERFFSGNLTDFFSEYLTLTLRLHLILWIRYGVALESNQQNSVLVLERKTSNLRLLLKDNDAARIHVAALVKRRPELAEVIQDLQDRRIAVKDELPLAQMFTTITLQLNIAAVIEAVANGDKQNRSRLYSLVRSQIEEILTQLQAEGENVEYARQVLLQDERLYIKYLLVAATLYAKELTGATDVNKHYGHSAPNFLREPQ